MIGPFPISKSLKGFGSLYDVDYNDPAILERAGSVRRGTLYASHYSLHIESPTSSRLTRFQSRKLAGAKPRNFGERRVIHSFGNVETAGSGAGNFRRP